MTGLLRCYVSRVENGRTVPTVKTLEKWAGALKVPMYRLFYDGSDIPPHPNILRPDTGREDTELWGDSTAQTDDLRKLCGWLKDMDITERTTLMFFVERTIRRKAVGTRRRSVCVNR